MPCLLIPSLMRDLTGGQERVKAPGRTVGQALDAADRAYPGLKARVCRDGQLAPGVGAFIDGRLAQRGLSQPVDPESEIQFLPAVGGG